MVHYVLHTTLARKWYTFVQIIMITTYYVHKDLASSFSDAVDTNRLFSELEPTARIAKPKHKRASLTPKGAPHPMFAHTGTRGRTG